MSRFGSGAANRSQIRAFSKSITKHPPLPSKLASFLDKCSYAFSLGKFHARILALGLANHTLLNCYHKLSESTWNSILVGYYRAGHFDQVLTRYIHLRRQWSIGLDSAAITFACKSCIELNHLQLGRGIHVDAVKFGLNGNGFVGYAHIGDFRAYEAFGIAVRMQRKGLLPNRVTLVSLLQAASQLDTLKEGRSVHGYAIRRGIGGFDEVFETSLMDMYNKCGAPKIAACIFGKMKKKTIGLWNVMIAGYLRSEQPLEAFRCFCQAMQEKYVPDLITFSNGILSCAHLSYLPEGKSIHGHIIRVGVKLDVVATTSLVDLYSKCYKLIQARTLFDRMEKKDAIFYDVMMNGYLYNYFASEATHIFLEMVQEGIQPNLGSILTVLSAISELKDFRKGKCIHGYVLRYGFDLNIEIANQMIYMYSKFGLIVCARKVFNKIRYRDLVSWTSMMMVYVHHGHADEAIILFRLKCKGSRWKMILSCC
ncbi:hypothetical protein ACLB2K_031612 [Fragaria x ananassa]